MSKVKLSIQIVRSSKVFAMESFSPDLHVPYASNVETVYRMGKDDLLLLLDQRFAALTLYEKERFSARAFQIKEDVKNALGRYLADEMQSFFNANITPALFFSKKKVRDIRCLSAVLLAFFEEYRDEGLIAEARDTRQTLLQKIADIEKYLSKVQK